METDAPSQTIAEKIKKLETDVEYLIQLIQKITSTLLKKEEQTRLMNDNVQALCAAQQIILSLLLRYDSKLQAWFTSELTRMVNRPQKTDNKAFEDQLEELLKISKSHEHIPNGPPH